MESTLMSGESGFLQKVFKHFEDQEISVDVIATSDISVSLTLDNGYSEDNLDKLMAILRGPEMNLEVNVYDKTLALLTLIVPDHKKSTKILKLAFQEFDKLNIEVIMMSHGATKCCISFVIDDRDLERCITALHFLFYGC